MIQGDSELVTYQRIDNVIILLWHNTCLTQISAWNYREWASSKPATHPFLGESVKRARANRGPATAEMLGYRRMSFNEEEANEALRSRGLLSTAGEPEANVSISQLSLCQLLPHINTFT